MGKSKNSNIENTVLLSPRCDKLYKKFGKKANPKLLKQIHENIDQLKTNSELGKPLKQNLKDMRSIHIDQFSYRIVYKIEKGNPSDTITIHAISHRKDVYTDLSAYLSLTDT